MKDGKVVLRGKPFKGPGLLRKKLVFWLISDFINQLCSKSMKENVTSKPIWIKKEKWEEN